MIRTTLITLASALLFSLSAQDYEVIAICLGDKNPTFNESQFQNIDIYYTPTVNVGARRGTDEIELSGTPTFLVDWMNGQGEPNDFFVIGENGVVYDQGTSILENSYITEAETERRGQFLEAIEKVTEGERTLREGRRQIDIEDDKGFVRRKLPNFPLMTSNGSTVSSRSVIDNGMPKLVIFFHLNEDTYLGAENDEGAPDRSHDYMRGRMESFGGVNDVQALIQIERELFENIIHSIY